MTLTHRPCGACRALVTPLGCKHWHPEHDVKETISRLRRRERDRQTQRDRRQRDREAVAEFQRQMGVET